VGRLGLMVAVSVSYSFLRTDNIIWYQSGPTDNNVNRLQWQSGRCHHRHHGCHAQLCILQLMTIWPPTRSANRRSNSYNKS